MAAPSAARLAAPYRRASPRDRFGLDGIDPRARPFTRRAEPPEGSGEDARDGGHDEDADATDKARADKLAKKLADLRDRFLADKRFRLLVVLQGVDASGKDGTVRHVFGRMGPLGVRCAGWRVPTPVERAHDPLWRIHQAVPADGEIVVFNRSHYEDAIVPAALGQLAPAELDRRLRHINDFERMLTETGTVLCKFMLHVSKAEQRRRLQARLDEPDKQWKFDPADLDVRRRWDAHLDAYDRVLGRTSTRWAPWTVVPADSKAHRNLMVASLLVERLEALRLRAPAVDPAWQGRRVR